jgi:arylsulfatase A-like enzyme
MAVYSAQVAAIDQGVGRVLETLKRHHADRDTLVIFLSDNGAAPDGGLVPHSSGLGFSPADPKPNWRRDGVAITPGSGPDHLPGPANTFAAYGLAWATVSNTPFRSTKLTAYEGGIRTPLIARWPAVITKHGAITPQVGHVIDLMPTLLDLAGVDYPAQFDNRHPLPLEGVSLRPVFTSQGQPLAVERTLAWSAPRNQAIRQGNWKLVNDKRGQAWQLFDLEADGTETNDLASGHPEKVAAMAKAFAAWKAHIGEE